MVYQHRTLRVGIEGLGFALQGDVEFSALRVAVIDVVGDEAGHAFGHEDFLKTHRIIYSE